MNAFLHFIKLHSIFADGFTIYTEDPDLPVHVMSVQFTHATNKQTNKQLNGTKNKNKTGQKHLNVNKHQSENHTKVKGSG